MRWAGSVKYILSFEESSNFCSSKFSSPQIKNFPSTVLEHISSRYSSIPDWSSLGHMQIMKQGWGQPYPTTQPEKMEGRLSLNENQGENMRRQENAFWADEINRYNWHLFQSISQIDSIMEIFHLPNWLWLLPSQNSQFIPFVPLLWQLPYSILYHIYFCDHVRLLSSNSHFIILLQYSNEFLMGQWMHDRNYIFIKLNCSLALNVFQVGDLCT